MPLMLEKLRRETRSQHVALERTPPMVALLRDDVSLDHYSQVLAAMRTLYAPLERGLFPALKKIQLRYGPLPYEYIARTPLLDRDLKACGAPQDDRSCSVPSMDLTAEQAVGVLYVLEGATRGGKIIAPHIKKILGLDTGRGLDLFSLHRYYTGWESYCSWLTELHLSSPSTSVEAARQVFESLTFRMKDINIEVQDD